MPFLRLARLAPLGPAPAHPVDARPVDDEYLESLRNAVVSRSLSLLRHRQAVWPDIQRAFPRPGHASTAVGVTVASVTLSALGLVAAIARQPEMATGMRPAPAVVAGGGLAAGDPALAELAMADPGAAEPIVADPAVAEPVVAEPAAADPAPAPDPPPETEEPVPTPPSAPPSPSPDLASEVPALSRISPTSPSTPAAAPPELVPDLPTLHRLHRLSRAEVLAITPFRALPVGESTSTAPIVPTDAGALPLGTGMWLYVPEEIEGGNVDALVARASQVGLTHVYVRTGSSKGGFYAQQYMDELLPKAHAAGIRVYGWDFPYLDDVDADVDRALAAVTYTTPSGDRLDGFAADIETASEGTNLSAEGAAAYSHRLRERVGAAYPLVAVVPRPSQQMQARYPYAAIIPHYDAVAPMTYWLNRQPDTDVANDVGFLAPFGKPVLPIGQAYDGAPEGGRPGPPPPEEIRRFLDAAHHTGAAGVSFWSWQHASQAIWDTLQAAPEFRWETGAPDELRPDQVRALQVQLTRLGYPVPASGTWDGLTSDSLARYQDRAGLARTGVLDAATLAVLMEPFNPPVVELPGEGHDRGGVDLGLVEVDLGLVEVDLPLGVLAPVSPFAVVGVAVKTMDRRRARSTPSSPRPAGHRA